MAEIHEVPRDLRERLEARCRLRCRRSSAAKPSRDGSVKYGLASRRRALRRFTCRATRPSRK